MKFIGALVVLAIPSAVQATYNCSLQAACMLTSVSKVDSTALCPGKQCAFQICIQLVFGFPYKCYKKKKTAFDHTCKLPSNQCLSNFPTHMGTPVEEVMNKYSQCQIVPPLGAAKFILYDADGKDPACLDPRKTFNIPIKAGGGATAAATCEGVPSGQDCIAGKPQPCLWTIKAPQCTGGGGARGDPHIKPWAGKGYSYHGEGDFVLTSSDDFSDGLGLDLQIRTKIRDFYSFIESAALRIGTSVFEITMGKFMIDGVEQSDEDLPATISGFTIDAPFVKGKGGKNNAKVYRVNLNGEDFVEFYMYKQFLSVEVRGSYDDFANAVGLMGDYTTGAKIARDGETVITEPNDFGAEWQVRDSEDSVIFATLREPQYPSPPILPDELSVARQRARILQSANKDLEEKAHAACKNKSPEDFDFCVFDILATGDLGMAGSW